MTRRRFVRAASGILVGATAMSRAMTGAPTGSSSPSPTWYQNLTSGQWGEIPDSKLENCPTFETDDTFPPYTGGGTGNAGSWNCMAAFSGGVLVTGSGHMFEGTTRYDGEIFLQKGGGHQIGAQAPYFLPLLYDTPPGTPKWKKVLDSRFSGGSYLSASAGVSFVDGYPVASQTYGSLAYIESENKMYQMCCTFCHKDDGSGNNGGTYQSVARSLTLDCGQVSPNLNNPYAEIAVPPFGGCGAAAHEKPNKSNGAKGTIWFQEQGTGRFSSYNVATNSYGPTYSLSYPAASQPTMACDQKRGLLCLVGYVNPGSGYVFGIGMIRTSNIAGDWYGYAGHNGAAPFGLNIAGKTPTAGDSCGNDPTIVWNPDEDCFVVWFGGRTLHKLIPPSSGSPYKNSPNPWTWVQVTPSGGVDPSPSRTAFGSANAGHGTYGRFQYVSNPKIRGYMLVHGTRENVYFYKV